MIGSGASGLAAAVSAERAGARVGLATKGSIQACNSAKAQGGIQAVVRRGRLARAARRRHLQELARERRHAARRGRSPATRSGAIHWLEELGVEFTRENGGYRLARCGGASAKRLLQVGDRTGHAITKALRDAFEAGSGTLFAEQPAAGARAARARLARDAAASTSSTPATVVLAAGGRCYRVAEERGELSTNHPNATGEVTRIALGARRRGARPRRAPVPPERRRLAGDDAGLLDPRDDARLRRRAAERRRRGVHRLARPARRRQPGDLRRGREGQGRRDRGRPPRRLPRHDADRAGATPRSRCRTCSAATAAPASTRSSSRSSPTPSSTTRTAA